MLVAEVIVKILESEGIEIAFGIPGASISPVYRYLAQSKKIRHYTARHEEGAAHAADGYARATGKLACCLTTSGPGATNLVTGLYTAQIDSIPLLAITGQNKRSQFGKEAFQCVNIVDTVRPFVKGAWCITEPTRIPAIFREAIRVARSGRPGPVLVDLPLDVQEADISYDAEFDMQLQWQKPKPNLKSIKKAIEMVLSSKFPILLAGGGVIASEATAELLRFAEHLALPVVTTYMGKGCIPADYPLYCGQVGIQCNTPFGNQVFLQSDLVLAVGCRFNDRHTGEIDTYVQGRRFIHIDIEPTQIGRIISADLGIVSDAKLALGALLAVAKAETPKLEVYGWVAGIAKQREQLERKMIFSDIPIKPQRVFHEINESLGKDTIFTVGCGLVQIWSGQFQKIWRPRHYLPSGGAGTLGYEIPAAVGAKIGKPEARVCTIVGDGGFSFQGEALAMASQYEIPIIVIVLNNGYLGLIRQNQENYGFEYGVNLWYSDHKVDFVRVAEGYGAKGERVTKPECIKPALERARQSEVPYVIDIIVERTTMCSMGSRIDNIKEYKYCSS